MNILSIETSCDETSVAIVRDGVFVVEEVTFSQASIHAETGGVVPEVASREHSQKIIPCLETLLSKSSFSKDDIDAIAVTYGPGLVGALLVGTESAKALSYAWKKPLIPVYHIFGHIYSAWLDRSEESIKFPAVILTVSGGHNDLYLMKNHCVFEKLGGTIDDAAGEAFDKVAKLLGLPYPGGPQISKLAERGNSKAFDFPRPLMNRPNEFSFSGLKTSVRYTIDKENLDEQKKADIAASFQEAITETLAKKLVNAAKKNSAKTILLVGGVSANIRLRELVVAYIKKNKLDVEFITPKKIKYCTDNASMIGASAYFQYKYGEGAKDVFDVVVDVRKR